MSNQLTITMKAAGINQFDITNMQNQIAFVKDGVMLIKNNNIMLTSEMNKNDSELKLIANYINEMNARDQMIFLKNLKDIKACVLKFNITSDSCDMTKETAEKIEVMKLPLPPPSQTFSSSLLPSPSPVLLASPQIDIKELIIEAVNNDCPKDLEKLLSDGVPLNENLKHLLTEQLLVAAQKGYWDSARILIKNGADVNGSDNFKKLPLIRAITQGNTDMVKLLLENGADMNVKQEPKPKIENFELTTDVDEEDEDEDLAIVTPFTLALDQDHKEIIQILMDKLIESGDNLKLRLHGVSVLLWAITAKKRDMVETIINAFAKAKITYSNYVDLRNNDGETLLMLAVKNNDEGIVKLLMSFAIADPTNPWLLKKIFTDRFNGDTILTFAIKFGQINSVKAVIQALIEAHIDPSNYIHFPDENGLTPLFLAEERKDNELVTLLRSFSFSPGSLQRNTFETMTHSLKNLEEILDATNHRGEQIALLCKDLNPDPGVVSDMTINWSNIITRYSSEESRDWLTKDGLKALKNGQITLAQFCTLTYCWAILKAFPGVKIGVGSLFDSDGKIAPEADNVLKQGLYQKKLGDNNFFQSDQTEKLHYNFFDNMKQQDKSSEKVFFYIEDVPSGLPRQQDYMSPFMGIGTYLKQKMGLNLFNKFKKDGQNYRVIPSFSMIQEFVNAYGGENTIAICPSLGVSSREDFLRNAQERGRQIYVPCFGINFPIQADGLPVYDPFEFLFHDIYHCLLTCRVPEKCRQETARIANIVSDWRKELINSSNKLVNPSNKFLDEFLYVFYGRLIDMEFGFFTEGAGSAAKAFCLKNEEIFLVELMFNIYIVTLKRMIIKREEQEKRCLTPSEKEKLTSDFKELVDSPAFCEKLINRMHRDGFFNRFKIDFNNKSKLDRFCSRMLDFESEMFLTHLEKLSGSAA